MRKIVFATNNPNKIREIKEILGSDFDVVSLSEIGCHDDIPETGATLEANAIQKAQYIHNRYGIDCFADDTGLEVYALNGAPGVHSARYAVGTDHNSEANMQRLLSEMQGESNRSARFRTVIALILDGKQYTFEGEVKGRIDTEKHGNGGFGYDPLFIPEGYDKSFAALGEDIKNRISHRARAVAKLAEFLKK